MNDNYQLPVASGGPLCAADACTVNGTEVLVQRNKAGWGADGTWKETSVADPFPTQLVSALPAGAALLGKIIAALQSGIVFDENGVQHTVKYARIAAASSGNNTIVAAVADKKIRVLAFSLTMTGTLVQIRWEDGADGSGANAQLTGPMTPLAGNTITGNFCPVGLFETSVNTLLNLELGGAQSVGGYLVYIEVP